MNTAKSNSLGVSDLRDMNRKRLLRRIWRHQPISRAQLSALTQINKATVSQVVSQLVAEGLVLEAPAASTGVGRTQIELRINRDKYAFVAIDVGAFETAVAVYDLCGTRLAVDSIAFNAVPKPAKLFKVAGARLAKLLESAAKPRSRLYSAGVSVPGIVNREAGIVLSSPPLGWKNTDVRKLLRAEIGDERIVAVDKSANNALRSELFRGGSLPETVTGVFVEIGLEVESAIILDGKILKGYPYGSGSYGSALLGASERSGLHKAERWGDLVSVRALAARLGDNQVRSKRDAESALDNIRQRVIGGERSVRAALDREADLLSVGFANILLSLGLPNLIVGGTIRRIWDLMESRIHEKCAELIGDSHPGTQKIRLLNVPEYECLDGAAFDAIGAVIPLELVSEIAGRQRGIIEELALGFRQTNRS